jgi:hypothetical protein
MGRARRKRRSNRTSFFCSKGTRTRVAPTCKRHAFECTVATVYYEYIVDGQKYGAAFKKPFIVEESGKRSAGSLVRGADFAVRINPWDASVTVPG